MQEPKDILEQETREREELDKYIMSKELVKYVNKSGGLLIVNMYNVFKDRTKILDNYKKVGRRGITLSQECYNSGHLAG